MGSNIKCNQAYTVRNIQLKAQLHNGIKEMLESALGFTGRLSEQLFKVGPGNRCFAAAAEKHCFTLIHDNSTC